MKNFFANFFGGNSDNLDTAASSGAITPSQTGSDDLSSANVDQMYNDLVDDNLFIDGILISPLPGGSCGSHACVKSADK